MTPRHCQGDERGINLATVSSGCRQGVVKVSSDRTAAQRHGQGASTLQDRAYGSGTGLWSRVVNKVVVYYNFTP